MKDKDCGYKNIVVSKAVYSELKQRGYAGDSFNDVILTLLSNSKTSVNKGDGDNAKHSN